MNKPAFPSGLIDPSTPEDHLQSLHNGMTLLEYAAIKLKVPSSGNKELDELIKKSLLNDFAAKAMQGLVTGTTTIPTAEKFAEVAYQLADAMMKRGTHEAK